MTTDDNNMATDDNNQNTLYINIPDVNEFEIATLFNLIQTDDRIRNVFIDYEYKYQHTIDNIYVHVICLLKNMINIRIIKISCLGPSIDIFTEFMDVMKNNINIVGFIWLGVSVTDAETELLLNMIKENISLKTLFLRINNIDDSMIKKICHELKYNQNVLGMVIDCNYNGICERSLLYVIDMLKYNNK